MLGQRRWRENVMSNFVGDHFPCVAFDMIRRDLRQAHDDGLVLKANHRKAARQTFASRLGFGETKVWKSQSCELTPRRQCLWPRIHPLLTHRCKCGWS